MEFWRVHILRNRSPFSRRLLRESTIRDFSPNSRQYQPSRRSPLGSGHLSRAPPMNLTYHLQKDLETIGTVLPIPEVRAQNKSDFILCYCEYLFRLHAIVRASVPLMQAALYQCTGPKDSALACYLRNQIQEELSHDAWLIQDIIAIHPTFNVAFSSTPPVRIAELVGMQYYWIYHHDKVALLGYIAALESNPPSLDAIDRVIKASGLPREGFRTLVHHAQSDPYHVEQLFDVLACLNLSKEQEDLILRNAIHSSLRMRLILAARQLSEHKHTL